MVCVHLELHLRFLNICKYEKGLVMRKFSSNLRSHKPYSKRSLEMLSLETCRTIVQHAEVPHFSTI